MTYEEIEVKVKDALFDWTRVNGEYGYVYRISIMVGPYETNVALQARSDGVITYESFPVQHTAENTLKAMEGFLRLLQMDLELARK
jgi:hypothetical protein